IRLEEEAPAKGGQNRDQRQQRDDIEQEDQRTADRSDQKPQRDSREDAVDDEFGVGDQEDHESPENDEMIDPERPGQDFLLAEGIEKHLVDPGRDAAEAVFLAPQSDEREPSPGKAAE